MIRRMDKNDIDDAMLLKAAAGWNQTRLDWERLLRLDPHACFVDEREGSVVATTTALRHGPSLAWIGMVLVDPAFRRQGIARGLMQHALGWLEQQGNGLVGLDATEMGRPLYRELAFRDCGLIERWELPGVSGGSGGRQADDTAFPAALLALDREACGFDRSSLIRDLAIDDSVESVRSAEGFAFGRPGSAAWQVGPFVATSERGAEPLVRALLGPHPGDRVYWDLFPDSPASRLARRLGFRPARQLTRMLRHDGTSDLESRHPEWVYAAAGFEFG